MWEWLLVPFAYLMGSLSSAIIVCHCLNLPDPRQQGSKNPGATNVLRFAGKKVAAVTLFGDVLKGLLPVLLAKFVTPQSILIAIVGLAAFLGHLYPVFFNFKGGKGIATAVGVLGGFAWPIGLALILTWLATLALFKISSLSALIAAVLNPIYVWWFTDDQTMITTGIIISVFAIWRHKANIQRLLSKEEGTVGKS